MDKPQTDRWLTRIPPVIVVGAIVVLLPLFALMTAQTIKRQKASNIRLLSEKGAALIRSFEAGTRTGMFEQWQGPFKLHRLITETAQQPDIAYIRVTDMRGNVRAADDPNRIGTVHGADLDFEQAASAQAVSWRQGSDAAGKKIFEVYRKFTPLGSRNRLPADRRHGRMMHRSLQLFPREGDLNQPESDALMIFIGLDMSSIVAAEGADARHAVLMGLILLFAGFTGVVLVFIVQSYRSARTSLSRVRAFSDELLERMPIGLVAVDDRQRIASVNPAACAILAQHARDLLGQPSQQVLPPDLYRPMADHKARTGPVEMQIDCATGGGITLPLEIFLSALGEGTDGSGGTLLLFRDLSEVRALQRQVAESQRLASVGKLAAGVAHEVRNPLSSIKGFATYFKEKYRDVAEDQHLAALMITEVDRLNRVVSQLLELARPLQVQPRPVDARVLIDASLKLVQAQAEAKNIHISRHISPGVARIYADMDRLNQVLLNLYLNAIEAMDAGGRLAVRLDPGPEDSGVRIRVSDNGPGIPKEDLPHIFDPYFTTKPDGTGLGLAIAHNIVEAHNGRMAVDSQAGRGTVMTIALPDAGK